MEQENEQAIIEKFQQLLRQFENDDGLKITHAYEKPTKDRKSPPSYATRTMIIFGVRGDGTPYNKYFMRKVLFDVDKLNKEDRVCNIFDTESHMYRNVLPLLGSFGPEYILATPEEIIMEDLKRKNYSKMGVKDFLDFEHCKAVMETLAALHAASLALSLKNPTEFETLIAELKDFMYPIDHDSVSCGVYIPFAIRYAVTQLNQLPVKTDKLQHGIYHLLESEKNSYLKIEKLVRNREKYRVLNHGYCWNHNIFYRHDQKGNVTDVKLTDFQFSRLYSPAFDLFYFIYTSAEPAVIEKRLNQLLKMYHEKFISELRRLSVPEDDIRAVSFSWLQNELKNFGYFGLSMALSITNMVFSDNEKEHPLSFAASMEETDRYGAIIESYVRYI